MYRVLVVGGGAVATMVALNIEAGGEGGVTMVLKNSDYQIVREKGFSVESVDYGSWKGWRPTKVLNHVPPKGREMSGGFSYVVVIVDECSDLPLSIAKLIAPAVTPDLTTIVMVQKDLNVEEPLFEAFPENIILLAIPSINAKEDGPGRIVHEGHDVLKVGAFENPYLICREVELMSERNFVMMCDASKAIIEQPWLIPPGEVGEIRK